MRCIMNKKIFEAVSLPLCVYDGQGRLIYGNRLNERFGKGAEDFIGEDASYLVEQGYTDKTPITRVLFTKDTIVQDQITSIGGQYRVTAVPIKNDDGTIEYIVETCIDCSELIELQEKIEASNLAIERFQAESKGIASLKKELNLESNSGVKQADHIEQRMKQVSVTDATMLILGESGTGKTHVARQIHKASKRSEGPFISINCSTIADNLFESELFGYAAGAFTGAQTKGKNGLVDLADGGVLFLDEIGEVPLHLQGKLLELIQEKRYIPVGALRYKKVDVKIVAATNQDLRKLVKEKRFREDLFYRLGVVEFKMLPLRKQKEQIPFFINYFLNLYNMEYNKKCSISQEVMTVMTHYEWPGNIRELKNTLHSMVIMALSDELGLGDLPETIASEQMSKNTPLPFGDMEELMENYKQEIVERCYRVNPSSRKLAAALNISQTKATRLIKKYDLKR